MSIIELSRNHLGKFDTHNILKARERNNEGTGVTDKIESYLNKEFVLFVEKENPNQGRL